MNPLRTSSRSRDTMVDVVRGLAILNIIHIHVVWWGAKKFLPNDLERHLALLVDVPLFFFISGWVLVEHTTRIRGLLRRLAGMYAQFLLLLAVEALVVWSCSGEADWRQWIRWATLRSWGENPWFDEVLLMLWFLPVYWIVITAATLLRSWSRSLRVVMIAVFLLPVLQVVFERRIPASGAFDLGSGGATLRYVVFYLFFFLLGTLAKERPLPAVVPAALAALPLAFILLPLFRHRPFSLQEYIFPPHLRFGVCSLASVFLAWAAIRGQNSLLPRIPPRIVSFLSAAGRRSLQIFLFHGFACALLYRADPVVRWAALPWWLLLPAMVAFAVAFTYLLLSLMALPSRWVAGLVDRGYNTLQRRVSWI